MTYKKVFPNHYDLPERINRLGELAYNLWWAWNPAASRLISELDRPLWDALNHNPIAFLHSIDHEILEKAAQDSYYLDEYDLAMQKFDEYMKAEETWCKRECPASVNGKVAYFSFEFGLHESMPFYAGGLGILSGDHLKEASDMGLPLVGVGFIYHQGYFVQKLTEDGWQETSYYHFDFEEMPIIALEEENGKPLMISVQLPEREVFARVWMIQVGRVPLYLLDSNVPENSTHDRQLTARLYSNDLETRISQEILLGCGGVRLMEKLGENPTVWHMNEGHSAFLTLERVIRLVKQQGLSFEEAAAYVKKTNVFTTHTPVPAGNDQFPLWLIDKYFPSTWKDLGLTRDQFIDLGKQTQSWGETFSMPVLAIKLSEKTNGVSELHGQVAREMWNFLWPDRKVEDVPIGHITNGVHINSWLARRMRLMFDRYLGANWYDRMDDEEIWQRIDLIPDIEIWDIRRHMKRKLINYAIESARANWSSEKHQPSQVIAEGVLLDQYSLTIGFARRFATYKRANLILSDYERLLKIITREDMPVQLIFAGKAHPADEPGKLIIQQVYRAAKDPRSQGRIVFLEDYDLNVARLMVQGVDVWMNTPRRPNEASGTSGMKAALNGTLNFSVLDGWWCEGYNGNNGWVVGSEKEYDDPTLQDKKDAESIYQILEDELVPLYYQTRTAGDLSEQWVSKIKESIRSCAPQFSTRRMLRQYMNEMYVPAMKNE